MKSVFAYLLAALVLLQTFSRELLVADYALNKAAITQQFCVNKGRPELHCDGKCYFAKQLKKQEERQTKSAGPLKERLEMLPAVFGGWRPQAARPVAVARLRYAALRQARYAAPLGGVFRPPLG